MENYKGWREQWACRYVGVTGEGEGREGVTHHTVLTGLMCCVDDVLRWGWWRVIGDGEESPAYRYVGVTGVVVGGKVGGGGVTHHTGLIVWVLYLTILQAVLVMGHNGTL